MMKKNSFLFIFFILLCLFHGTGCDHFYNYAEQTTDSATIFEQMMNLAQKGNPEAQYHVGMMYNNGSGVKKDIKQAFNWFEKSAKADFPLAAYKLGCYYGGQAVSAGIVPLDNKKALYYKLLAAKAGYLLAQNDVAKIYYDEKNFSESFRWLKSAADQGDAQLLYRLSFAYMDGVGTDKDPIQAYAYFKIAQLLEKDGINEDAQQIFKEMASKMSESDLKQAENIVMKWKPIPTLLTLQAKQGIERAKELIKNHQ